MNRGKLYSWTIILAVLSLGACSKTISAAEYDIIRDGKLTRHGAIVGRSTQAGDGKDDNAFILSGLYKFVYAGAGFRSTDARIHARLSINNLGNTGAGVLVNGHWFTFDIGPGKKIGVTGPAYGKTAMVFAEAEGRIKPGVPFDVDILIKDGILTCSIDGEKVGEAKEFPSAMETVPSSDVGSVHKLGVITALRSWRADLKIYEFHVKTEGEIVPLPEMQTIYQSGSTTTHTYRIPALLVSKKGTLLAFAEARRNSGGDTANIDTVVRRSEDDGKTWGDEIVVFDEQDNVAGNPCPVVDQSTGRIWSLQTWNSHQVHEAQMKSGFGEDSRRVFVTYSDDDGKTWAKAKDITASAKQNGWSWYATGPGAGIQLQRGKHKGRLIIPCDHTRLPEGGPKTHHSHILYSDDHGETWHIGAQTGHGLNECEAVELENGDVMLNSRNHGVDAFHRGVSISEDGGQTFSSFRRDKALLEPRCQASIRRYRWASGDKPGIILFSNPARKWRDFLMLRMSYDDAKTWPDARIIFPFTSAYSDITVLSDSRIAVLFERDNHTKMDLAILPALQK
ncbi:glycoside hydrolase [Verrucomicrobia bacterium]|nr:glycoside hydrolase [Verrucomicrobiota bacterium]